MWLMRLMLDVQFVGGFSLFQYFNVYADSLGGVSTLISRLLSVKRYYGRNEQTYVVELLYGVMKYSLLFRMNGRIIHNYEKLMENRIYLYSLY